MQEVLVVGASVAGAATAIHLARRGRKVLLLDRAVFPRRKACGEGLFPAGARELRDLGLFDCVEGEVLEELRFHGYGHTAQARLGSPDAPALGVRRAVLDAALMREAALAGVEVRQGVRVGECVPDGQDAYSVLVERRRVEAAAIVAADGLGSSLRRQAGLEASRRGRRYGVSAHVELRKAPEPAVEVFFRPGFEVYVTPVRGRLVNVAVLMSRPLTQMLAGQPDQALEELLRRERCLPNPWKVIDAPMVAGPFPVRAKKLSSRNLVLAGDAAGFFDGITGEGISLALVSARQCAEAVDDFLRTGSSKPFARYEKRRRALARNSELLGRLTLALAAHPVLARRAIRGLSRHPVAFSKLVAISSGEAGLRSLRPSDLLGLMM